MPKGVISHTAVDTGISRAVLNRRLKLIDKLPKDRFAVKCHTATRDGLNVHLLPADLGWQVVEDICNGE